MTMTLPILADADAEYATTAYNSTKPSESLPTVDSNVGGTGPGQLPDTTGEESVLPEDL